MNKQKILITGASGNLGRKLTAHLEAHTNYEIRGLDINPRGNDAITQADFSEWDPAWAAHFEGVDTVVHLAANPNPFPSWEAMIPPNLDSVINVFGASAKANVKRIIFASSNHVMGGYRDNGTDHILTTDLPPLPGINDGGDPPRNTVPYGAYKLVGERLGKCYNQMYGISFIGVRIGWVRHGDNSAASALSSNRDWYWQMWLSDRDYCQLMHRCIDADESIGFAVINGMSNNARMRWDLAHTAEVVGFVPQDGIVE